jgi:hypothetical protein
MDKSWMEWVNENLQRNCDPGGIAEILLANKFTLPAIQEMMGEMFPENLAEPQTPAVNRNDGAAFDMEQIYRKRESLMQIQRSLAKLSPQKQTIERRSNVSSADFLENYYVPNRPVILCGLMKDWQAPVKWTPEYLKKTCGDQRVEIMASRESSPDYEMNDAPHRKNVTFGEFVDMVTSATETNDYYLTARNEFFTLSGTKPLLKDFTPFKEYLKQDITGGGIFFWFGPKGTLTPLHHDPMNIFMTQVQGRKIVKLIPANEIDLIYNHYAVYSLVDIENPDYTRFPKFREATIFEVELAPGEALFLPVGWWHSVKSLDQSMTLSFNNFIYPNSYEWFNPQPRQ